MLIIPPGRTDVCGKYSPPSNADPEHVTAIPLQHPGEQILAPPFCHFHPLHHPLRQKAFALNIAERRDLLFCGVGGGDGGVATNK